MEAAAQFLVLGVGNRLMGDDAVGSLAVEQIAADGTPPAGVRLLDGGTIGLALLPELESARGIIAIDAARFGGAAGTVRVFEGAQLDRYVGRRRCTVHEAGLADLLATAALAGALPALRALVAVEPSTIAVGTALTEPVRAALPRIAGAIDALLRRWQAPGLQ